MRAVLQRRRSLLAAPIAVVLAHPGHHHTADETRHDKTAAVPADELSDSDRLWVELRQLQIPKFNTEPNVRMLALQTRKPLPVAAQPSITTFFTPFKKKVKLRWDGDFLYVESNGMPDHDMLVGITAWQQQVPIPQPYFGIQYLADSAEPGVSSESNVGKDEFLLRGDRSGR